MPVKLVLFRHGILYLIHENTRGGANSRKMDKQTDKQTDWWMADDRYV